MTTTTTRKPPESSLQMYVDVSPGGQVDSVTPVRWCVGRDIIEFLRDEGVSKPKVLFVTFHGKTEVARKLVPLEAEMTYLSFSRPGANEVKAVVVYDHSGGDDLDYLVRESRSGVYIHTLSQNGRVYEERYFPVCHRLSGEDSLTINVPSEMFAKKPNKVVAKIAGVIFSNPKDQCDLRRQFLLSIPLIPAFAIFFAVGAVLSSLLSAVILVGLAFLGFRGISLSPLWHPFSQGPIYNFDQVNDNYRSSVWIHEPGVNPRYRLKHPVWWILNPVCIGAFVLIGFIINASFHLHAAALKTILLSMIVPTVLLVIALLVGGAIRAWYVGNADKRAAVERKRKAEEAAKFYRELEALTCNGPRDPSLGALPRQKRTVTLRFQALKSKVCRPYAK